MSDLGRRSRRVYNPNNDYINNIIQTGIAQKILPDNFRAILGNNTNDTLFKTAYDEAIENGFVFAQNGEADTDFFGRYWEQTQNQIRDTHTAVWRTPAYQEIEGKARVVIRILQQSEPQLIPAFSKIYYFILRTQTSSEIKQAISQVTGMSGTLQGGKIADESKSATWVKPVIILGVIGAVVGVGYWKKDEIMEAVKGEEDKKPKKVEEKKQEKEEKEEKQEKQEKDESINGVGKSKKGKKGLGKVNKGLQKMLAINKSAKTLQNQSGYEMRNVKEVEVKTVKKSMPKLSWKEAQKRAKNLYKGR